MSLIQNIVPNLSRKPGRRGTGAASPDEVTVKPAYEVKETADAWGLTVFLPGVTKEGMELFAEEGLVTVRGRRAWAAPKGWMSVYRESIDVPFELVLQHDNLIDVDKIHAELKDGVLRVSLPKAEAVKPRKIQVT
ncbi:MAG: Hsp20/alpha crystallin family protein [Opitutaceae bacterium]|nr:Hsp20/alpha crystallin family protein [Opitutaceae bacterium]